jgi:hypothetical protein
MMATEQYQNDDPAHRGKVASPVEARQGVISGRIVTVLLVSLVLAIIALGASYYFTH